MVEDEALLAMDLEAMLANAGCLVVGPAQTYAHALHLASEEAIDVALLDANLAGQPVDGVAATLVRRGIPFAFASGYGPEGLPDGFRDTMLIAKPFREEQILRALQLLRGDPDDAAPAELRAS